MPKNKQTVEAKTSSRTSKTTHEGQESAPHSKRAPSVWDVFTNMGALPAMVKHDGYLGTHPADLTCHSCVVPTAENVLRHIAPEHGIGTFKIKFRVSDVKTSPFWQGLADAGIEIKECYCPHCRKEVQLTPKRIIWHLNPHPGATTRNLDPMVLCFTLGPAEDNGAIEGWDEEY